jgi:N-acetylmuramoyl-L-alanine amidase
MTARCIVHRIGRPELDVTEHVKAIQTLVGADPDGVPHTKTVAAVRAAVGGQSTVPAPPRADESQPPTLRDGSSGQHRAVRDEVLGHRLVYAEWSPDEVGKEIKPEIIVIHYTVAQSKPGTVQTFKARDYLSVHLCIGTDGSVTQMVPFNRLAYHAGESSFQGRTSVNQFSIGIELVNPGPVFLKDSLPSYVDTNGRPWIGSVVKSKHKNPACKYDTWAAYSQAQVDATVRVCQTLCEEYGITHVVGHDDVAPGRKIDPGPAWQWGPFLERVFPREHQRP